MLFIILFGPLALVIITALLLTRSQKNPPIDNHRNSTERAKVDSENYRNINHNGG
ncbi:hypothetical protein [Terribacillus sp. AE2B 122]|uniref:hypothetical protein n=1 Tax=Terribacillus sp. AE2B 122 TaxID=1331902 RepID=UPI001581E06D|nr:hypothetical protein [Terribacillus sp. AE2B 122]